MTEDEFMQRISPSIFNIIEVFNAILDDAENHGLYPQSELDILEENRNELLKNYDSLPQEEKLAQWEKIGEMTSILKKTKNKTFDSIESIWEILSSLEIFYHKHILKDEDFTEDD